MGALPRSRPWDWSFVRVGLTGTAGTERDVDGQHNVLLMGLNQHAAAVSRAAAGRRPRIHCPKTHRQACPLPSPRKTHLSADEPLHTCTRGINVRLITRQFASSIERPKYATLPVNLQAGGPKLR